MYKFLLLSTLIIIPAQAANTEPPSLPSPKQLKSMFNAKEDLGCLPLIEEGNTYHKCLESSRIALNSNSYNLDYETFTLGQLKLLATRSPINSKRMQNAKYVLRSIGHPIN
ncbi:hypothetical protein [Vibrio sp. 10N.239.312.D08]|uniref:hypothetical protein n=1 Tax=Vibrio sp. 10N.239.312.D08 TaxID=3229978 RepID=UPI00354FAD6F